MEQKNSKCSGKAQIGEIAKINCMAKIQQFSELTPNILFTEYNFYELYSQSFESSELGRIKRQLPFDKMAESLGLYRCNCGRKSHFRPKGKVSQMFLKMKTGLSYPKL